MTWLVDTHLLLWAAIGSPRLPRRARDILEDEEARLLFVHAGVDPRRALASQGDTLWWGKPGFGQWSQPYGQFDRVVRGFDAAHGGYAEMPFAITVDSGCGFGGRLTAICLSDQGEVVDRLDH